MSDKANCGDRASRRVQVSSGCGGLVWLIGWLFTIGFLGLGFGKGLLALLIWPVYLGKWLAALQSLAG
jgi:hypothetical protein